MHVSEGQQVLGALGASLQKELCPQSGEQERHLPRAVHNTILKKYMWVPVCSCKAQGKLHMLLDFYLALSDRSCSGSAQAAVDGAGTVPAHSSVRTQVLSHKSDFQQHSSCSNCQVCSEATETKASRYTCGFSRVSPRLTDSLDSQTSLPGQPWRTRDREKAHSPHISAITEVIREISVKETQAELHLHVLLES